MSSTAQNSAQQATVDHVDQVASTLSKACNDVTSLAHESVNVLLQSVTVIAKGYEELLQSYNSLFQNALSQSAAASRAALSARSARDFQDLQSGLAKNGFDFLVGELGKISQISARTAQQATEPVANHVNATITKISSKSKVA